MSEFPTLETGRLLLREITEEDTAGLFALYSHPEVVRYFDIDPYTEVAQAEQQVRELAHYFQNGIGVSWGIFLKDAPGLAGTCSFTWSRWNASALLGYDLHPAWWGRGIMTEALREILLYGFVHQGLNRVQANTGLENQPSVRLLNTIGFREEGILREAGFWGGEFHDVVCFALLRREFLPAGMR